MTWRRAAAIVGAGAIGAAALLPFDGAIVAVMRRFGDGGAWEVGGDLRRELLFLQQYGAVTSVLIVCAAIFVLDRTRRVRLLDLAAGVLVNALAVNAIKILVGRPRPRFNDPLHFSGPFHPYPLVRDVDPIAPGVQPGTVWRHSWEVWGDISSDLWSMPSSHTAAAMVLSAALVRLYPALRPLVLVLAVAVAACRVLFTAHYASDVVVGAAIGWVVGSASMDGRWGTLAVSALRGRRGGARGAAAGPSPRTIQPETPGEAP